MEKNQEYTIQIKDMTTEGEGIGKADGFPLFVKDTVIGDIVRVKVVKVKKTYGYARLAEILTPSPDRTDALCPVARPCGGCSLQAMNYPAQLEFKRRKIENNLRRIGGLADISIGPVLGMEHPWRYRNKAQLPLGTDREGHTVAGFYAGRTHSIVSCEDCLLSPESTACLQREVLAYLEEYHIPVYDEVTRKGMVRHLLIRTGFSTGQIMVCLVLRHKTLPHAADLVKRLRRFEGVADICLNINQEDTNVILGPEVVTLYGPGYIEDRIGDLVFRISAQSFFQVNPVQTEVLYDKALEFAGLTGSETVWDLYCGIGTISLFLARKAGKVYGVEVIPAAIKNARENALRNGIKNAVFFTGRAEEILPSWYEGHREKADVIVLDPPRKGCDPVLLSTILDMQPQRIVYVSCDSATLARDLKILTEGGYQIAKVQGVDLFPQTPHVETACLLNRLEP